MPEIIISKRCSKCKENKSLSDFYKNYTAKDGYRSDCKACRKKYSQTEKHKASQKRYRQTEKGKFTQRIGQIRHRRTEKYKANQKRYYQSEEYKIDHKRYRNSEKGKATIRENALRYKIRHPERRKAKAAVQNAIRIGKLPPINSLQCHYGEHPAEQYHHWHGYAPEHWLDVIPVCCKCHNLKSRKAS